MIDDQVRTVRNEYDHCFGCGISNESGLRIEGFRIEGDTIVAGFNPRQDHRGFSDLLHGGIIATALDEIMAWTAILCERVMVMTGNLQLRYRKPAKVTAQFRLEGEVLERSGKRLKIVGRMLDGDTLVAEASGLFLAVEELE
jgi:acyl-coenzyme A thioesterase PaaI-like protein